MAINLISAIKKWEANGGKAWQLIEPVDGFHTNQVQRTFLCRISYCHLASERRSHSINGQYAIETT